MHDKRQTPATNTANAFVQYCFDNADFNVTLDGHNTFHSMGGIRCLTPRCSDGRLEIVPRIVTLPSAESLGNFGHIPLETYVANRQGLREVVVKQLSVTPRSTDQDLLVASYLDCLWLSGYHCSASLRCSWGGFMQTAMQNSGQFYVSGVEPLPFINMDPSNLSTIYTALLFARRECDKNRQKTCIVTFDQPLFIKAFEIVLSSDDLNDFMVRLGGFHLLMSFMGAVGKIMAGSGLEELWGTVFAQSSVCHMLTGHAYPRALRANFLTQEAMTIILLEHEDISLSEEQLTEMRNAYESLLTGGDLTDTLEVDIVSTITDIVTRSVALTSPIACNSRTAKLWLQYWEQVKLIRNFVRAERTGNWALHIDTVTQMLPYLHASGHLAYAKSAHLYVQSMEDLTATMDANELKKFTESGFFAIRRSDRYWSGVWSDMTIEQVLMRAIKVSGGLTRGRGITPSTLARWVDALPLCLGICNALEDFTGIHPQTSEQHVTTHNEHKDLRPASRSRDRKDLEKFLAWLREHSPFSPKPDGALVSLSSGVVADETINCEEAIQIGKTSMHSMIGKPFSEVKLRRKDKVKSLESMKKSITVHGEEKVVNPQQLFNRIACALNTNSDNQLCEYFKYELSPFPPALFDEVSMRKTTKSVLTDVLLAGVPMLSDADSEAMFVLDGGMFLHRVVWPRPATYREVCELYVRYVKTHYGSNVAVVFDGYSSDAMNTKSEERRRRAAKTSSAEIVFEREMMVATGQAQFLANSLNKTRLIEELSEFLLDGNVKVHHAKGDADRLLVTTALGYSEQGNRVVLVGNDADLLVMLLVTVEEEHSGLCMCFPGSGKSPERIYNILQIQASIAPQQQHLLFLHAITGCDTTSAVFKHGKRSAHKLLKNDALLACKVKIFNDALATHAAVASAGEEFFLRLYGSQSLKSLDELRFFAYNRTVSKSMLSSEFQLSSLPPTSAAARQHSFRAYLQVQQWKGNDLSPTDWGWEVKRGRLVPITTDMPPAPESLINLISCNCRAGCRRGCGCRKTGIRCSAMCFCMGNSCNNSAEIPLDIADESLEDQDDSTLPDLS